MSTEENNINTASPSSDSPSNSTTTASEPSSATEVKPAQAAALEEEWHEEPGDDIGNRLPVTPAESAAAAATEEGGGETAAKKRKRRRRKKGAGADGAASEAEAKAEGTEGEPGEAAEGAEPKPAGEPGKGKRARKRSKSPRPDAPRPAFGVGEEVFGRISKVTEDAIWVDISGKATGLFDFRELFSMGERPEITEEPAFAEGEAAESSEEPAEAEAESAALSEEPAPAEAESAALSEEPAPAEAELAASTEEPAPAEAEAAASTEEPAPAETEAEAAAAPKEPRPEARIYAEGELPQEGDQFVATVASHGIRGGMLMLSRYPLDLRAARQRLEAASKSGELVEGFVTGAVKGGLEVDLGGLRAFAPASHVDMHHGADLSYLVGRRLDFAVAQYAKKGRDVVVSRKDLIEAEARKARSEALAHVEPGSLHKGIVRSVVAWGAFIALPDAGGVEGLVHLTEASHDRGARLSEVFKAGEEVEVKVLRVDERGKLWLSRKAATPDPWEAVRQKYAVGTRHTGKVARIQPFGAFIELETAVDGLIHTSDLSLKPIESPSEVLKVGDDIEVIVASIDPGAHKIGLHPAPPAGEENEPRQRVQPHKPVKVAVVQALEGGLIVRILGTTGRSARGFVPAGQTGTARGTDLRKTFPVGTILETKVLEIDPRRGEAKLSIRALKEDGEKQAYQQYRAGVARDSKFGTFADLLKKR